MSQFDVRVVAYQPGSVRLGPVDVLSINVTLAHSDAPSFSAKITESTLASLPAIVEVAVEFWDPATSLWVEFEDGRFIAKAGQGDDKDPAGIRTITGVGLWHWMLSKNVIAAEIGDIDPAYPDGHRPFEEETPGSIIKTFIDEGKARGWGAFLEYDFSHDRDSDGVLWADAYTIAYKPGLSVWSALSNLADQAIIEFKTSGRVLHVYRADRGQDLSVGLAPVRVGNAASNMPVQTSIDDLITHVTVFGENNATWEFTEGATNLLGRLEGSIQQGGVSRPGTAAKMASSTLTDGRQIKRQITATEDSLTATSLPSIDYLPGDWVLARVNDDDESLRVMEVQIRKESSITIDTVLNDRFIDLLARTAKRANGILGGTTAGGTGVPPVYDERRAPKAPIGVLPTSEGYWTEAGEPRSSLAVRWVAVTEGLDGEAVNNPTYELWWREFDAHVDTSTLLGTTIAGSFGSNGYEPGKRYAIKVRAVSEHGVKGPFAAEAAVTMEGPSIALDAPTAPLVWSSLGVVTVEWDGQLTSGGTIFNLPPQFLYTFVTVSESEGGPYLVAGGTLEQAGAQTLIPGLPLGSRQWIRLHAIDKRGYQSLPSTPVAVDVLGINLADLDASIGDAITAAQVSADGKSRITRSEEDPSGVGNEGDVWWRYDGALVVGQWRWDPVLGGWSPETLDGLMLSNLDAGKINVGYLDVESRIQAGSITTPLLAVGAITADRLAVGSVTANAMQVGAVEARHLSAGVGNELDISANASVNIIVGQIEAVSADQHATGESVAEMQTYYQFGPEGAVLSSPGSSFQLALRADRIEMLEQGVSVSHWNAGQMFVRSLVGDEVVLGNHKIEKYGTGTVVRKL